MDKNGNGTAQLLKNTVERVILIYDLQSRADQEVQQNSIKKLKEERMEVYQSLFLSGHTAQRYP